MASRAINLLTIRMQQLYYRFDYEMKKAGLFYIITCTARTTKEQVALYAQGRQELEEVNELRNSAGMPPITNAENQRRVTWTLKSEHLIDLDDTDISNNLSRAFDIAMVGKGGKAHWDIKVSVNENDIPDYIEAGQIGEKVGLVWGGRWKSPDYPHFQQPK